MLGDGGTVVLVRSRNNQSWLFPKGHVEEGEDDEAAARREIAEEAGLSNLEFVGDLGEYRRPRFTLTGKPPEEKIIKMFLFATPRGTVLASSLEIEEARWFPFRELSIVLGTPHQEWFASDRAWFASVAERVRQAIQRD